MRALGPGPRKAGASAVPSPGTAPKENIRALAANLGLLKAVEELALALPGKDLLLLKGGALIADGTADIRTRGMEDMDLLVRQDEQKKIVSVLFQLGFRKRPGYPQDFVREGVVFDLHTDIWYLTAEELNGFWERSRSIELGDGHVRVPRAQDHLLVLLSHAALHHSQIEEKWAQDVRAVLGRGGIDLAWVQSEAARLGLLPAIDWYQRRAGLDLWAPGPRTWRHRVIEETPYPIKGLALRLLFVRGGVFRLRLAARTLFPERAFLMARYDSPSPLWTVLRPFLIAAAAARAAAVWSLGRLGMFNPLLHRLDASEAERPFRELYQGPEAAAELAGENTGWEPWEEELLKGPLLRPGKLLDVGCGTGRAAALLERRGFEVTGIDPAPEMIKTARALAARSGRKGVFSVADAETFDAPPASFDAVYFTLTLYSSFLGKSRRLELLGRMRRLLRPGGVLMISGYGRDPREEGAAFELSWRARNLLSRLLGGYSFEKGDAWLRVAGREPGLFHRFAPEELAAELEAAGFKDGGGSTTCRIGRVSTS